jgi:hypothetical protein
MSTPVLDASEDREIVDAFDRACSAYPHAFGGDAIVDGMAAASDDSDDAWLGSSAVPHRRRPTADGVGDDDGALAMPPAESFVSPAGAPAAAPPAAAAPPPPMPVGDAGATPVGLPTPPVSGDTYGDLLRSWYYAGYYSGLHEARQRAAAARGSAND